VTAFDQLHPALQHHIVNSLGWRELRPFQEAVIPPILAGEHLIILAPTAGGKTEAGFFPVLSRMLSEAWAGLSVLYVCPLRALLNNLDIRLQRYCRLLGRRSGLWHGDVKTSARRQILRDPPDCLLTTPESLEVMLVSQQVDRHTFFSHLRVVIIDEIHAFAGDDRGWHLMAVLERISRLSGREIQRLGLSATVGNPDRLLDWMAGSCKGPRRVMVPPPGIASEAEVKLDYVGSLANAATVISRLHRGQKRLIFVDSRSRVEELASQLRQLQVSTFVTHSSLSREQRHDAEQAFVAREDCVIVATSVLELGIDVGDLDHVIQIDAPATVSSFLQRMGRTGRRSGTERNCLFLATSDTALLRAAALIDLWASGFVEPVTAPPLPLHVLAQQIMALALQEHGVGKHDWRKWIGALPSLANLDNDQIAAVLDCMLQRDILWDEGGILWFGRKGEEQYGRRNFMDILSIITSEPLFAVRHGHDDLGFVHQLSFAGTQNAKTVLLLAGRSWQVNYLDWRRKIAYVEPAREPGRSRWVGAGHPLSYEMSQAIRGVLASDGISGRWSRRGHEQIGMLRQQFPWARESSTTVLTEEKSTTWWTFGGDRANAAIAAALQQHVGRHVDHDSVSVAVQTAGRTDGLSEAIEAVRAQDSAGLTPPVSEEALEELKFSACLPIEIARRVMEARLSDVQGVQRVLTEAVRYISMADAGG
jgi:ATP-dependent Lhr-like helicase